MAGNENNTLISTHFGKIIRAIIIVTVIGFMVSIGIAFFVDFEKIIQSLLSVSWDHLAVPFFIYIGIYIIDSIRLKLVLWQFQCKIRFKEAFTNSMLGYFFAYLTPMATGGQPFQIYHLKSLGYDAKISTNIIMSRFIVYLGSALLLTLAFIPRIIELTSSFGAKSAFLFGGLTVTAVSTILIVIMFIRPDAIGHFLAKIENSFLGRFISRVSKRHNWGEAAKKWSIELRENILFLWKEKFYIIIIDVILCNIILAGQVYALVYVFMAITGVQLFFFDVFITVMLLNLVVYYIPSPGASGGIEGVYSMVFTQFSGKADLSVISIIIWRFATYYMQIFLGFFFFLRLRNKITPKEEIKNKESISPKARKAREVKEKK